MPTSITFWGAITSEENVDKVRSTTDFTLKSFADYFCHSLKPQISLEQDLSDLS